MTNTIQAFLPTKYGDFQISIYKSQTDNLEHVLLTVGDLKEQPVLTRIHSKCLTGDTFSSLRCDCQEQLIKSMKLIQKNKSGIIIYLNQEGRGVGLFNKIKAYALQEKGFDTVDAQNELGIPIDDRDYKIAVEILKDLNIAKINLLTNNPDKIKQVTTYGVEIVKRIPLEVKPNKQNQKYLLVKKQKLGHFLK